MNEWENPSAFFFWSFSEWILLRRRCGSSKKALSLSFPARIYLTGRICEIVASLDNHRSPKLILRVITRQLQKKPTTTTLCCGHFFKRWLRELGVHSTLFFCNEVRNSHFTKLPLWWRCRQAGIPQNAGMQRGLKLLPKVERAYFGIKSSLVSFPVFNDMKRIFLFK